MRFLHTSDWHLGRTMRGLSRHDESAKVLRQVVDIAQTERVDAVIIAGDTFDTFSPPAESERLLYDTLHELLAGGIRVISIAGNHDNAARMDALSGVLRIAGADCIGSVPSGEAYRPIRIASADGNEATTVVALPWVPERSAVEYERLFGGIDEALQRYDGQMARGIRFYCGSFADDTANVFVGHMLIDGAVVGEGGGERKLHIGHNFAVKSSSLPETAQYIALGHVHKTQELAHASAAFYSGSLLQLDFGESEQRKYVNIVDVHARQPAQVQSVEITAGRTLRTIRIKLDDLPQHADRYGDDYLRVIVDLDAPMVSLYDKVRDLLPNALDVTAALPDSSTNSVTAHPDHRAIAPDDLLAQFYAQKNSGAELKPELRDLFNELYQHELEKERAVASA